MTISGRGMVRGGIKASNLDFPQESPGECLSPEWLWENIFYTKIKIGIQAPMPEERSPGKCRGIDLTLNSASEHCMTNLVGICRLQNAHGISRTEVMVAICIE